MNSVTPDTNLRTTVRCEETVKAVERAAQEERGIAAERAKLLADLTAIRDQLVSEHQEIDRQLAWWQQRYPTGTACAELTKVHAAASEQLTEGEARLVQIGREQQAHEVAAAELAEYAVLLRAEWEVTRPHPNGGPDRTVVDGPGPDRTGRDTGGHHKATAKDGAK